MSSDFLLIHRSRGVVDLGTKRGEKKKKKRKRKRLSRDPFLHHRLDYIYSCLERGKKYKFECLCKGKEFYI
jgi:hypothetical protein